MPTPLAIAAPEVEVAIVGTSTHIPFAPSIIVAQVQLIIDEPSKEEKVDEEVTIISSTPRKSLRFGKLNQE